MRRAVSIVVFLILASLLLLGGDLRARPQSKSAPDAHDLSALQAERAALSERIRNIDEQIRRLNPGVGVRSEFSISDTVVPLAGMMSRGDSRAPVVLIMFGDFECPYCGTFVRNTLPAVIDAYVDTSKVQFVFAHYPLSVHINSGVAAQAAECANAQGNFWKMHDLLFADQSRLSIPDLVDNSKTIGLERATFQKCLTGTIPARLIADYRLASRLDVKATPTFFIGTRSADADVVLRARINGARDFATLSEVLEQVGHGSGPPTSR